MENTKFYKILLISLALGAIIIVHPTYATVPVWNYSTTPTAQGSSSIEGVSAIAISEDGNYVTAASHRIYLFSQNGTCLWIYTPENYQAIGLITDIAINEDGQYIAIGITNRNGSVQYFNREGVRLWNYTLGKVWKSGYSGVHVVMSDDGGIVAVGSQDSYVYRFTGDGALLWKYSTENNIRSLAMSSNGSYIAVGTNQGNIFCFSANGTLLWQYQTGGNISNVEMTADGRYIIAGFKENETVSCIDNKGSILWNYSVDGRPTCISVNEDGSIVAAVTSTTVYCIDNTGSLLWDYSPEQDIVSIKISSDGEFISVLLYNNQICYFNKNGDLLWKYPENSNLNASVCIPWNTQGVSKDGYLTYVAASAFPCYGVFICNIYFFNPDGLENDISASPVEEAKQVNDLLNGLLNLIFH